MTTSGLPTPESFADLAGMLVGKRVRAKKVPALAPTAIKANATYVDGSGAVAFVALADLALVASLGAALAMIPPTMVQEAIRSGKPGDMLVENAYEILNVAASLFNDADGSCHVKVTKLEFSALPADLATKVRTSKVRLDLDVEIPGYPNGKVAFVAVGGA